MKRVQLKFSSIQHDKLLPFIHDCPFYYFSFCGKSYSIIPAMKEDSKPSIIMMILIFLLRSCGKLGGDLRYNTYILCTFFSRWDLKIFEIWIYVINYVVSDSNLFFLRFSLSPTTLNEVNLMILAALCYKFQLEMFILKL